jgi:hypothetical protein
MEWINLITENTNFKLRKALEKFFNDIKNKHIFHGYITHYGYVDPISGERIRDEIAYKNILKDIRTSLDKKLEENIVKNDFMTSLYNYRFDLKAENDIVFEMTDSTLLKLTIKIYGKYASIEAWDSFDDLKTFYTYKI